MGSAGLTASGNPSSVAGGVAALVNERDRLRVELQALLATWRNDVLTPGLRGEIARRVMEIRVRVGDLDARLSATSRMEKFE